MRDISMTTRASLPGGLSTAIVPRRASTVRAAQEVHRCDGRMAVHSPPGSDARLVIQLSGTGPAIGLREP